jgi:hypothetical protein
VIKDGQKYVVNTDNWFVAPDGQIYKAAWGTCYLKSIKEVFGFEPSRPSTNWYLEIGGEGKEVIVAGCQIHYATRCENHPHDVHNGVTYFEKDTGVEWSARRIYIAE